VLVLLIVVGLLVLLGRTFLEPYGTAFGQFWLVVVAAMFTAGIVMLDRMSEIDMPERFTPRRANRAGAVR
jgi:hypothetical protein